MLLDLINLRKIKRALLHLLIILVVLLFQNIIMSRFTVFGVKTMFLPAAAVAAGLFEGGVWGAVFGLVLGVLGDSALPGNGVLFTVLFPCFGFFTGMLTEFLMNKRFFPYICMCVLALAITAFCQMFGLMAFYGANPFALLRTALIQLLWSLPFAVLVFFPFRAMATRSDRMDIRTLRKD